MQSMKNMGGGVCPQGVRASEPPPIAKGQPTAPLAGDPFSEKDLSRTDTYQSSVPGERSLPPRERECSFSFSSTFSRKGRCSMFGRSFSTSSRDGIDGDTASGKESAGDGGSCKKGNCNVDLLLKTLLDGRATQKQILQDVRRNLLGICISLVMCV